MRVAVTFCNQHATPRLAVLALDLDTGARAWLDVPDTFDRGAAGTAELDGDLLVACQPGGVVRYDHHLGPVTTLPTAGARNLHSILVRPDERAIYVTSAHNDTLFRYALDDAGTHVVAVDEVYCADPERRGQDRYHLNSVTEWRGELYVTMFGPSDGPTHRHRRNGRVVRVPDGEVVAEGLYHPHTAFAHGDALFVVESQSRTVRRIAGGPAASWTITGGYPRGVVATSDSRLWVGVSALRRESSSLGTANVLTGATPIDFQCRLVELDLTNGETGRSIDLTPLASEVFDVRPLPAGVTFAADPHDGLAARVSGLAASWQELRAQRRVLQDQLDRTPTRRLRDAARRVRRRLRRR